MLRRVLVLTFILFSFGAFAQSESIIGSGVQGASKVTSAAPYPTLYMTNRALPTSGSSAEYMGLVGNNATTTSPNTTELRSIISIPGGGGFYGIAVNLSGANLPTSTTLKVQMLKNGSSNTAYPNCTVAAAGTNCTDSTAADTVAVNGTTDYVQYELTITGGTPAWPSTQTYISVGILFVPSTTNGEPLFNENANGSSFSTSSAYAGMGVATIGTSSATEANVSIMVPTAGTVSKLYAAPSANETALGTHTIAVTLGHNNSVSDSAVSCTTTILVSTACSDTSDSISVAAGDTLSFHVTQTGSTSWTNQYMAMGVTFTPTTPGQSIVVQNSTGAFQSSSQYFAISGFDGSSVTQSAHYNVIPTISQLPNTYSYTKANFQDLIMACSAVGTGYRITGLWGSGTAFTTPAQEFLLSNGSTTQQSSATTLSVGWQSTAYGIQDTTDSFAALGNTLIQLAIPTVSGSLSASGIQKSAAVVTFQ